MEKEKQKFERFWDEFSERLRKRLEAGAVTYGDRSFTRPLPETIDEIQQELEDVAGWALVAWGKMQMFKEALESQHASCPVIGCWLAVGHSGRHSGQPGVYF